MTLRRITNVAWRVSTDRVIVHRTDGTSPSEMSGDAMLVWLAVDEPGTVDDLVYRLAESGIERTARQLTDAIAALTSTGWLTDY